MWFLFQGLIFCAVVGSNIHWRQQTAVAGVAPHAKKRRSVKIAISGPKARRAVRRSFHVMPTRASQQTASKKKGHPCTGGLESQRKRRLTPSRHRRHDRLLAKCGLVITGQFFGSFGH